MTSPFISMVRVATGDGARVGVTVGRGISDSLVGCAPIVATLVAMLMGVAVWVGADVASCTRDEATRVKAASDWDVGSAVAVWVTVDVGADVSVFDSPDWLPHQKQPTSNATMPKPAGRKYLGAGELV